LRTHAPCDDLGKPAERLKRELSPAALLHGVVPQGATAITFSQWLELLLKLAALVYPRMHADNSAHALDAVLHELIVPLHTWRCVHRGARCAYDTVSAHTLYARLVTRVLAAFDAIA
jgi:hypothetical protein